MWALKILIMMILTKIREMSYYLCYTRLIVMSRVCVRQMNNRNRCGTIWPYYFIGMTEQSWEA